MASCHGAIQEVKGQTDFTIALAGNPNVGKSSLFNQLTGLGVITANYPGKTVELNLGTTERGGYRIAVVDLPGTYALGAVSDDQWAARQGVLDGQPEVVIVLVDATNLERNLYMVLQFLDLELPVILALNLVDEAARQGIAIDTEKLAGLLGVPVVETVAIRGLGVDRLIDTAIDRWQAGNQRISESTTEQRSSGAEEQGGGAEHPRPFAPLHPRTSAPTPSYGRDVVGPCDRLAEAIAERLDKMTATKSHEHHPSSRGL